MPLAFRRPQPGSSIDRDADGNDGASSGAAGPVSGEGTAGGVLLGSAPPSVSLGIDAHRRRLPVFKHRADFLAALEKYPVLIIQGQTGSGKTSQLPQYCMEAGWAQDNQVIACTQPRRVAATSIAARVAEEVGSVLGDEVGYTIRFEDLSSPTRTRIKYCTDGMLFREAMLDPLLSRYSVVMIDEAHERTCYTDLLLGLLKKIRKKRPELRIIISSATIDAEAFLSYFNDTGSLPDAKPAVIMSVEGRMFPVETAYLPQPTLDYVDAAVQTIQDIHLSHGYGDILVFLTGREEIERCLESIVEMMPTFPRSAMLLRPLTLHAGLSSEDQLSVFEPAPARTRKVIISTNLAEASVTIEGIRFVVDCGFVKLRVYNAYTGMDVLRITATSQASANQRAGRSGRTSAGKCFRLYSENTYQNLPHSIAPEICRSDVSLMLLQLKALGIDNIVRFDFMDAPPSITVERAIEYLYSLGALGVDGSLTKDIGSKMAELPVDVGMAKILLGSADFGCSAEILTIAAMVSVQNVFISDQGVQADIQKRKFIAEEGDHLTLLNVYNAFVTRGRKSAKWCSSHCLNFKALSRAVSIRLQLAKYMQRFAIPLTSCNGDHKTIRRCLVSGYFKNAAKFASDGTYTLLRSNATLHVHPNSIMFTRTPSTGYVIFHDVIETTKVFMRDLTVIDSDWLVSLSNGYYQTK